MNLLRGIGDTTIIDDTYNSSPAAAVAALRTLYDLFGQAPQRIAILGDMRELGETSKAEHEALALACDPGKLEWVVTVGPEMATYLTPVAKQRGCQVKNFMNPVEAAEFVRSVTREGAAILAKGSQNTIFLEEAVKNLCMMSEDVQLVRQSPEWMEKKQRYFESLSK
jgi:UDP-N-acetylmuramoyl-tripeptide--D-alanyl-D-alanine ligase